MANPLPKTKAPALKKNQPICISFSFNQTGAACSNIGKRKNALSDLLNEGGARYNHTVIPANRINHKISVSVMNVVTASITAITHSNLSLPKLLRVNL